MKKFNKLFLFVAALFVGVLTANAKISLKSGSCTASATAANPQTCTLTFDLSNEEITVGREITMNFFNPTNIKNNTITVQPQNGWKVKKLGDASFSDSVSVAISEADVLLVFKYEGTTAISAGNNIVYTNVQYDKEDVGEGCGFAYGAQICKQVKVGNDTLYFGVNGISTTKEGWEDQCTCTIIDYGSTVGKKYYGKDGKIINTATDWTEEAAAEELIKQCYACETDLSFDGRTYQVGKAGDLKSSSEEVLMECYTCKQVPGKDLYVGKTKVFDNKEDMLKECEVPSCKVVDDKYYDKDGKEITQEEYNKQCKCRIEETENGKVYYNDKNEVITADEYTNQCQTSVPTGAQVPYIAIIGGIVGAALIFFIVKNKSKFKRI